MFTIFFIKLSSIITNLFVRETELNGDHFSNGDNNDAINNDIDDSDVLIGDNCVIDIDIFDINNKALNSGYNACDVDGETTVFDNTVMKWVLMMILKILKAM